MDLWYPPKDRPHLLEWWRPLILASAAARHAQVPWPIHLDELVLVGRIDRPSKAAIWVYRHPEAGGELYLDGTGQAYRFTRTPKARGYGRFTPCDLERAIWAAGLPRVVEPVFYREPPPLAAQWPDASRHPAGGRADELEGESRSAGTCGHEGRPDPAGAAPAPGPRRRGHLTVHDGGESLAG
jgi:hypothetical protein